MSFWNSIESRRNVETLTLQCHESGSSIELAGWPKALRSHLSLSSGATWLDLVCSGIGSRFEREKVSPLEPG